MQLEVQVRETEGRLTIILDSFQIGVVIIRADTNVIVDVNPTAANLIGLPKEQIVGQTCHRFIYPIEGDNSPVCKPGHAVDNSENMLGCVDISSQPDERTHELDEAEIASG